MELPANPTELQVKHELSHYLDAKKLGFEAYRDIGRPARESLVLDRLQSNRIWNQLNDAERNFSSWPATADSVVIGPSRLMPCPWGDGR
jgi:hypothetical protein